MLSFMYMTWMDFTCTLKPNLCRLSHAPFRQVTASIQPKTPKFEFCPQMLQAQIFISPLFSCPTILFHRCRGSIMQPPTCRASFVICRLINRERSQREKGRKRSGMKRKSIGKRRALLSAAEKLCMFDKIQSGIQEAPFLRRMQRRSRGLEVVVVMVVGEGKQNARFHSGKASKSLIK